MAQAAKKRNSNNYNTKKKEPGKKSHPALIVIGCIAALVLGLCSFHVFGKVGDWLKYAQFGLFGWCAYILPLCIIALCIFGGIEKLKDTWRMIFIIVLYLSLGMLVHLSSGIALTSPVVDFFNEGAVNETGGGIICGTITAGLYQLVSRSGSYIITILLLLFSVFMIMRRQFMGFIHDLFNGNDDEYEQMELKDVKKKKSSKKQPYYEEEIPAPQKKTKVRKAAEVMEDPEEEPTEEDSKIPERRVRSSKEKTVYETKDGETVVRIVKTRSRKAHPYKRAKLERTKNRSTPMRDASVPVTHTETIAKGIGNTSLTENNAGGDEIHEITRVKKNKKKPLKENITLNTTIEDKPFAEPVGGIVPEPDIKEEKHVAPSYSKLEAAHFTEPEEKEEIPFETPENTVKYEDVKEKRVKKVSQVEPEEKSSRQRASLSGATISTGEAVRTFEPVHETKGNAGDNYQLPPLDLLSDPKGSGRAQEDVEETADKLVRVLETFGVNVELNDIQVGPSVTRFELKPEMGTRVSKITSLTDDLKLNLAVSEMRIEAPIPGKAAIGIEIPNKTRTTVTLKELMRSETIMTHKSKIAFSAGKDISGNVIACDLAKMPHMLVAGTTGSGKSVFLNSILMCILYRAKPTEVGLIIVDPKKVEFGVYQGIPHLMKPVVTDPGQAVSTLRWAVGEMTNRYQRMQMSGVRDFKTYNEKFDSGKISSEEENPKRMQQIVIVIDELADLMMVAAKEVESLICRLAQLARAAGIHLIIATQRPSVDVVTGLIKANIPARVALLVASGVDSRTIIDMVGAEKLLGNGDMLFYPTGYVKPVRVQGAFVSDEEIARTVRFLMRQNNINYYEKEQAEMDKFDNAPSESSAGDASSSEEGSSSNYDEYIYEAGKLCIDSGKASSSMLQRRFSVGFNRAARIIDQLEDIGVIGPQNGAKPREILVDSIRFEEICQENGII